MASRATSAASTSRTKSLFWGWPALRHWIDERRNAEQTRRRLEEKADEWQRLGGQQGGLLDQIELAETERWLTSPDAIDLGYSRELETLVASSRTAIDETGREKEAARQRELEAAQRLAEEQQRRADERARRFAASLRQRALLAAAIGVAAIVFAVFAGWFGIQRARNANLAEARQAEARSWNANLAAASPRSFGQRQPGSNAPG